MIRLLVTGILKVPVGQFVLTHQRIHRSHQFEHHRILAVRSSGFSQSSVCTHHLPFTHKQPGQLRPGSSVFWIKAGNRTKCLKRGFAVLALKGGQPHQKMRLG
jgi:hypothetical protein